MYRWLKDGAPITEFSTGQYYRIPNTERDDAGQYNCMARNDAGTIFSDKIDVVVACKYTICLTITGPLLKVQKQEHIQFEEKP